MTAYQVLPVVVGQRDVAVIATEDEATAKTVEVRREASAVEVDQHLFAIPETLAYEMVQLPGDQSLAVVLVERRVEGHDVHRREVVTRRAPAELRQTVAEAWAETGGVVAATSARCRESLRLATESLERARTIAERGEGEELVAAEVRTALTDVGKVVGSVYTDDLLDRIFSRFCIGK